MNSFLKNNSICSSCNLELSSHKKSELIACATSELSKNNTKKMFEKHDTTPCPNIKSLSEGESNYE